jgi:pimeloyl-ACP methyl ester carboxylesterase
MVAFDLPSSGELNARALARRVKSSLTPLCPHWIVVGNSLGGWIAAWLALDWTEGVSKLMLVDAAGMKSQWEQRKNSPNHSSDLSEPTIESMKEFQRKAFAHPRPIPDSVWPAIVERARQGSTHAMAQAQKEEELLDSRLPSLRRPTAVFWGEKDQITPIVSGHQMRGLIPSATWHEAKDCGHLPQKECPLELIQELAKLIIQGAS